MAVTILGQRTGGLRKGFPQPGPIWHLPQISLKSTGCPSGCIAYSAARGRAVILNDKPQEVSLLLRSGLYWCPIWLRIITVEDSRHWNLKLERF